MISRKTASLTVFIASALLTIFVLVVEFYPREIDAVNARLRAEIVDIKAKTPDIPPDWLR